MPRGINTGNNGANRRHKRSTKKIIMEKVLPHTLLILFSIIFIGPFLWLVSTSLKSMNEVFQLPPTLIPKSIKWDNYIKAFTRIPYMRYTINTLAITVINVIGQVISSSLVAYSVSKINWWGKKYLFPVIVATMMIPFQVTMIPIYIIFQKLGMVGTYWPLILPAFGGGAFYIFLLRQFFMTIPDSLIEAATIDGAGEVKIFFTILMPLVKPVLATVAIFTFLANWSDFMGPLLYINTKEKYTLSLGLQAFLSEHVVEWNLLMAASAIFTIPIIIIFFFAQKQFIEGITITGIKG